LCGIFQVFVHFFELKLYFYVIWSYSNSHKFYKLFMHVHLFAIFFIKLLCTQLVFWFYACIWKMLVTQLFYISIVIYLRLTQIIIIMRFSFLINLFPIWQPYMHAYFLHWRSSYIKFITHVLCLPHPYLFEEFVTFFFFQSLYEARMEKILEYILT
jgi:hypothetical protein